MTNLNKDTNHLKIPALMVYSLFYHFFFVFVVGGSAVIVVVLMINATSVVPGGVVIVSFSITSNTSASLSWIALPVEDHNGNISGYSIYLTSVTRQTFTVGAGVTSYNFTGVFFILANSYSFSLLFSFYHFTFYSLLHLSPPPSLLSKSSSSPPQFL